MLIWFNRNKQQRAVNTNHEEMYRKNEEQLVRERVSLAYDVLRSLAK